MASEKPEDPMNNTAGTDDETIAQRRKRLRRVSFADREITSVHIFKRDEDYETPPNPSSASESQNAATSDSEDKVIRFFGELAESEDTGGDGEEDEPVEKLFFRPKNSPSSGGSTIGSATSDDEDSFFGPVSSHFINPGRLSDATISEENHDMTMDSTAFSMHFRSLAMSESGDLRTPVSSHAPVEEDKTPTQVTSRSDTGSAMVLTYPKKLFPKSPVPVDKGSGGGDSNDMSLVGEDSRKYDYGVITPALAALLGDESKEPVPESQDNNSVEARSPVPGFSFSLQNGSTDACQMMSPCGSGIHPQMELQGSGNQSAYFVGRMQQCVTPSPQQGASFMSRETLALVESLSTIQKSKSRLGLIPPSPASALSQRIENSKLQLSGLRSVTTPSTIGKEETGVRLETRKDIPITNLDDLLSKHDNPTPVSEKQGAPDQLSCGSLSPIVDNSDVFTCTSPEGNINSKIEGSLLKEQERNQTARTPDKFVAYLAKSSDATTSAALNNCVTLQDPEQQSKGNSSSEAEEGHVTENSVSNPSLNTLSDHMDSLLVETRVSLCETGFLNGSAQQNEEDSVLNKNRKGTNNFSAAHSETEVISTEDCPLVVTPDRPGTAASSPLDRRRNEASHAKGPSRLKRKSRDVDPAAENCSPKVRQNTQDVSNPVMDHPDENDVNNCRVVREQVNWVEIPGKVSVEINQIFAPLGNKLNSRQVSKLEDTLTYLKKVHLSEMLCLQIKSQKVCDDLTGAKTKRRAESRSLLCKLAYEKAKLELLHLKQEIMRKKSQVVITGLQTSETLRLNCAKLLRQHDFNSTGLLIPVQPHEATTSKVAEITQEIEELDAKIKTLIKCIPTCDKTTGEPAYTDAVMIAEDQLKKKMSCRLIRQDTLGWRVDSLGEKYDCQSIVLNYGGLINQRLTLKPGHDSCVIISNNLSDAFIKQLPDMNVSTAFKSLLSAEYSRKYVGTSTLLEITQKTSLVVHNLLNVAEELQLARMEIPNLVQGQFESPSAEQLYLQISFVDCKNLRKVIITLDMACLTHGMYPGDIIPGEVTGTKRDGFASKQLMKEIESAVDGVAVGYPRILRLCRCVSKLLQSQSSR
ncbi:Uncharacterized protein HA466_0311290 [Hirschfeldia incana]|nr:Uncharacterized protein HA466_0311290 [Hirschfeldia incana]